jgi:hypothetical protein
MINSPNTQFDRKPGAPPFLYFLNQNGQKVEVIILISELFLLVVIFTAFQCCCAVSCVTKNFELLFAFW